MSNGQAKQEILELVAAGKITAQEAADMLSRLAAAPPPPPPPPMPEPPSEPAFKAEIESEGEEIVVEEEEAAATPTAKADAPGPSWFRVRVSDLNTGKRRVSVNIPLRFVKFGFKLGAGFVPEMRALDWDELNSLLQKNNGGVLVDVENEEGGEHIVVMVD